MRGVLMLLMLTACMSTTPRPMYARDGGAALYVECRHSMTYCFDAAAQSCPQGYVTLDSLSGVATVGVNGLLVPQRMADLTFRCK